MVEDIPKVRRTIYTVVVKRILDLLISGTAIVVLSPLLIVVCALEFVVHGRPILFSQERAGFHCKTFKVYKFRSMTNETDGDGNLLPEQRRVTKFGRFIRRFSIDELPELFCVLSGKMSVIGPRPLLVRYLPHYTERHLMRHEVKPGFACAPLRPMKTWTWNDQFENDICYIENCSFWMDVKMFFAVAREAMVGDAYRVDGVREEFTGINLDFDAKGGSVGESASHSTTSR